MPYREVAVSCRKPVRRIYQYQHEVENVENLYNGMGDIFISPWWYDQIMWTGTRYSPNYETAIVDKLHTDFDELPMENARKIIVWARQYDIRRRSKFSGNRGIHISIKTTDGNPESGMVELMAQTGAEMDEQMIKLNKTQMQRVENTMHMHSIENPIHPGEKKYSHGGLFCIPVTEDEIFNCTIDELREKAKVQRFGNGTYTYGHKTWDISDFDARLERKMKVIERGEVKEYANVNDILSPIGYRTEDLCKFINTLLSNPEIHFDQRYVVATFLKDKLKMTEYDRCMSLFKRILSDDKFWFLCQKDTVYHIYRRDYKFNPEVCPYHGDCTRCDQEVF